MLRANEFSVGSLKHATCLSLLLSDASNKAPFLVSTAGNSLTAVSLLQEGDFSFESFNCANTDAYQGLLIPNISIEVDEKVVAYSRNERVKVGSICRMGSILGIFSRGAIRRGFGRFPLVILEENLQESGQELEAFFPKWQITIDAGQDRHTLFEVNLTNSVDAV